MLLKPTVAHTDGVTPIPGPDVRAELDRILASKGFATAGRLSKLLRYVVEKTLAGETDQLKEYAVGIEDPEYYRSWIPDAAPAGNGKKGVKANYLDTE